MTRPHVSESVILSCLVLMAYLSSASAWQGSKTWESPLWLILAQASIINTCRSIDSCTPVRLRHPSDVYLGRWLTLWNAEEGFPGCKHTVISEVRDIRDQRARGGVVPWLRPWGNVASEKPCCQSINDRVDRQVTITWANSLSLALSLFLFYFSVFYCFLFFSSYF